MGWQLALMLVGIGTVVAIVLAAALARHVDRTNPFANLERNTRGRQAMRDWADQ